MNGLHMNAQYITKQHKTLFSDIFSCLPSKMTKKHLKSTKQVENGQKDYLDQLLGVRSTQKLVEIPNNNQTKIYTILVTFCYRAYRSWNDFVFDSHDDDVNNLSTTFDTRNTDDQPVVDGATIEQDKTG